ncbi:hypothetical protein [Eleftheria terrae]|uniref:hypothetical protein n=1 Tax=Eleftheria terrae TaxID=1597781 RepID=UPI00263A5951|nr:hypothetical protein [Eleftheria terrae]WKB50529.1 hypothetical protein N7L95_00335 [Eleftheria terrae]
MMTSRFADASPSQQTCMASVAAAFLHQGGSRLELLRVAPGEWHATWQRQQPREQLKLATIYEEREADARSALLALVWDAIISPGALAAAQTERLQ